MALPCDLLKMDTKLTIKEEADVVDHFARIPEDLFLSILSRLEDLKHMCQCSLVSKRFALTIYQIKAVSLSLPSTEIPSSASADDLNKLFPKLAGFTSEEATRFIQSSSLEEMKFFPFLGNFRGLRSISLEFTCPSNVCSSSLFKMRVKFSSGGAVVQNFVSLVADYVYKDTERWYANDDIPCNRKDSIGDTFLPFGCCTNWLLALCLLLKCQPSLESVTITNGKKQGKLVLKDEQLVAWRNSFVPGGLLDDFTPYACTRGWICRLRMPHSRYVLKGVNFVVARLADDFVDDGGDALTWEYVGEEKMLADAVNEYLRRYGDPFMDSEFSNY